MNRPVQYFTPEYLEYCKQLTPEQIINFLEQFRAIALAGKTNTSKSKLISIKIPVELLESFKFKARSQNQPYQAVIKNLMRKWLLE